MVDEGASRGGFLSCRAGSAVAAEGAGGVAVDSAEVAVVGLADLAEEEDSVVVAAAPTGNRPWR